MPATTTEEITDQDKVWGAIKGLADSLGDPYTTFFPPVESEIFESDVRGNFEGVGMEIKLEEEKVRLLKEVKTKVHPNQLENQGLRADGKRKS